MHFRDRYLDVDFGSFIGRDPLGTAMQGDCPRVGKNHGCADEYMTTWLRYHDGMNLYAGYFGMWGGVDPSGLAECTVSELEGKWKVSEWVMEDLGDSPDSSDAAEGILKRLLKKLKKKYQKIAGKRFSTVGLGHKPKIWWARYERTVRYVCCCDGVKTSKSEPTEVEYVSPANNSTVVSVEVAEDGNSVRAPLLSRADVTAPGTPLPEVSCE